ncbi:MAG: BMP family ABC transporter substrate-binding protein [Anaerovoracaceae bacterium]
MKRKISVVLVLCLAFLVVGCSDNTNEVIKQKPMVIMLTGVAGIGDQSFNDSIWASLEKAQEETEVEIRCIESKDKRDFKSNIKIAAQDNPALVVCVGSEYRTVLNKVAEKYKDTKFLLVDDETVGENVSSISFAENESGFLAGVSAAMETKSKIVGFVGGEKIKSIKEFNYGFIAGVKSIDEEITVISEFTGNFNDKDSGFNLAKKQNELGADVIFQAAGIGGLGVIECAGENDFWVIGVDKDQSMLNSKHVLCSAIKNFDEGIMEAVKKAEKGEFQSQNKVYDLKENGVGISDRAGNLSPETKEVIAIWTKAIEDKKVIVPDSLVSLESYEIPEI